MTPNERHDMPWIIAAGVMALIAVLALKYGIPGVSGLMCWSTPGCEF